MYRKLYMCFMQIVTYTDARARLKAIMDSVVDDHVPVAIARRSGSVVMVSLEDWNSMQETNYLLATPANAKRLREGIAQLDRGEGVERELID